MKGYKLIMTLEKRIQMAQNLTHVEVEIGYYILQNIEKVSEMSILELADSIHVSKSTAHRFCKKIGYEGFQDFKLAIGQDLATNSSLHLKGNVDSSFPNILLFECIMEHHIFLY